MGRAVALGAVAGIGLAAVAWAQEDGRDAERRAAEEAGLYAPSVWDLELGAHATELNRREFIDYACGTNGGPPSLPINDWTQYAMCPAEPGTGFHEVFFQYDDELEYWAKAQSMPNAISLYAYTSAYAIPIIPSGLFDAEGFLRGIRIVTDSRVPVEVREKGVDLGGYLTARYGEGWTCTDLPRQEGEQEYQGTYIKDRCVKEVDDPLSSVMIERRAYRKSGQFAIDPRNRRVTEGQFESSMRLEQFLTEFTPDYSRIVPEGQARSELELLVARALDCPGCDLTGVNLKRADLSGANLAGAILSGANLHGAILAGANLSGAVLTKANVNRADLKRANLQDASLREAMIYETRFDGADLRRADLAGSKAGRVQMIRANLEGANMVYMDLRGARMNDTRMAGADLSASWLWDVNLNRADLSGAKMLETDLIRADMIEVNLTGANLGWADLLRANLRGANLTNADFSNARLTFTNLSETTIDGAIWDEADLPPGFPP